MKVIGWLLVFVLVLFSIIKKLAALVLYPLVYHFRDKVREVMYKNSNAAECVLLGNKLTANYKGLLVRPLWWFLDDSVSDVGGRGFVRDFCKSNSGEVYDLKTENAYALDQRPIKIKDKTRRFFCAYMWSADRNPMTNFSYDMLTLNKVDKYEIVHDSSKTGSPKIKYKDGKIDVSRTELGTIVYYINGWLPCVKSSKRLGNYSLDMWVGFLYPSGRFEATFRPAKWRE